MKRPILAILIGYIIGILWGYTFKISIVLFWLCIFLLILVHKIVKYKFKKVFNLFLNKTIIGIVCLSSLISNTVVLFSNNKYDNLYNGKQEVEAVGIIISSSEQTQYKQKYKIKVEYIDKDIKFKNTNLILYTDKDEQLEYGDKVKIKGEYKSPEVSRNMGGFSQKEYYKTEKIYGMLYAENIKILQKESNKGILFIINKVKQKLITNTKKLLPEETSNLLIGILLGEKNAISDNILEEFRDSNLYHLLAVSGAHVGYLCIGILLFLEKIGMHKRKRKIMCSILLVLFMFLTGLTPSVVRACMMVILVQMAFVFYKKSDVINTISFSLLIILVKNPFKIQNIGLQLSYMRNNWYIIALSNY